MGTLGRFQVLAGGMALISVLGIAIVYGATEALPDPAPSDSETTPPLVTLGEFTTQGLLAIGGVVLVVGAIVLWEGISLIDAADDFERVVHHRELDRPQLESALRHLRGYYRLEFLLSALLLAAALLWAWPQGWP
jgi:hypothetical protein